MRIEPLRVDRLRVGHVIGQLSAGGAEGQLRLLTCSPCRRSTPIVYCLSDRVEPYGEILEASGVALRKVEGGRLSRVRRLQQLFHDDQIDVVHAWLFVGNAYAWAANSGRRPLVTAARNCKRQGAILDFANRRAFAASALVIANSALVETYIRQVYAAPGERIRVVHNGVDLQRFALQERAGPRENPTVVAVGRVVRQKNPELFVAAARKLLRELPHLRFRWIGEGEMRERIVRDLAEGGLEEQIVFEGLRTDIENVLDEADLLWLTSDWEGLPNVVMEAMASALPVVATDVGGTSELFVTGAEGRLIAAGDVDALLKSTRELLLDSGCYAAASRAAVATIRTFSVDAMVGKTEAVYEEACAL